MVIQHRVQRNSIVPTGQGGKLRQGIWDFFHMYKEILYLHIHKTWWRLYITRSCLEPQIAAPSTPALASHRVSLAATKRRATSLGDVALGRVNGGSLKSKHCRCLDFNSLLLFSQTARRFPPSLFLLYKWVFNIRREARGARAAGRSPTALSR